MFLLLVVIWFGSCTVFPLSFRGLDGKTKSPDESRQGLGKIILLVAAMSFDYSKKLPRPDTLRADRTALMIRTNMQTSYRPKPQQSQVRENLQPRGLLYIDTSNSHNYRARKSVSNPISTTRPEIAVFSAPQAEAAASFHRQSQSHQRQDPQKLHPVCNDPGNRHPSVGDRLPQAYDAKYHTGQIQPHASDCAKTHDN